MINIIAVGRKHESWLVESIQRYEKRLRAPFDTKWEFIPPSKQKGFTAREEESERILKALNPSQPVFILDERGKLLDSPTLSKKLEETLHHSSRLTVVIGGAYGVNDNLRKRANFVWSLSPLVFPHQLVRLILAEQIYRSQTITNSTPYHNT